MRRGTLRLLCLFLALCLLPAGCRRQASPTEEPAVPPAGVPAPDEPAKEPHPVALDRLTVEVVVDWADADRVLGRLEDLSSLLERALASLDCTVEEPVTITIGTAGGITAQALKDGGIDAAFLPGEDFASVAEGAATGVLMNTSQDFFLAASAARPELDEDFRFVLEEALTTTEDGQTFLETCYPGVEFVRAAEDPPED